MLICKVHRCNTAGQLISVTDVAGHHPRHHAIAKANCINEALWSQDLLFNNMCRLPCCMLTALGCRWGASTRAATHRSRCATSSRASVWTGSTQPAQAARPGAQAPTSAAMQARCAHMVPAWPAVPCLVAQCQCLAGGCWGSWGLSSEAQAQVAVETSSRHLARACAQSV
jgi:hypothetical protein